MSTDVDVTVREVTGRDPVGVSEVPTRSVGRLFVTTGGEPPGLVTGQDLLAARAYRTGGSPADATRRESVTAVETGATSIEPAADGMQDQSICERCGTLAGDLTPFNGQLVCPECRIP